METSALKKSNSQAGFRSSLGLLSVVAVLSLTSGQVGAEIIVQTSSGNWVGGLAVGTGFNTIPSIVLSQTVRGNSGYLAQRALAWSSYHRPDNPTGFLLADPMGNGSATATNSRQASLRGHMARANAYRLNYFAR